jgi:two-component system chemotaxis response regulator CheY
MTALTLQRFQIPGTSPARRHRHMAVRTLIVDDAPTARIILQRYLVEAGCVIVGEADCSARAEEVIESEAPDLVTLDIHMPEVGGMDSYSLFRKVRKDHPRVEFVVVSGATFFQNRQDFLRGGAIGYFAKPIDFRGLLTKLRVTFPELTSYRPRAAVLH